VIYNYLRRPTLPPALAIVMMLTYPLAGPLTSPAWAISDPAEALASPQQEARAVAIGRQLRCLVCQNESIEDSGADLARDLRRIVRQRVQAGETDRQVTDWLVARYGNFVRLNPPVEASTMLLWGSPVLALLAGLGAVWFARRSPAPPPLSEAERVRLRTLLDT
jgi:cytochrome c-type biogenesis protein CcmH